MSRTLSKTTRIMSDMSRESTWKMLPLTKDDPIESIKIITIMD